MLSRATQGQFAPGSTWKPIMAVGALNNGFSEGTQLDCSSGVQVGNRWFKNYESASYGYIDFAQALQLSCDTFFYRVGIHFWLEHGTDPTDVNAKDPLIDQAKSFGFGSETGVDLPGEASGRIADRHWKLAYFKAMKSYYCKLDEEPGSDFIHVFAHEFCLEGNYYREGDAVNYSIGQGDTIVTPLQLARAYAALSNGGTLWKPQLAKAIVSPSGKVVKRFKPKATAHVKASKSSMQYVDEALLGTPKVGTLAWKFIEFPLDTGACPRQDRVGRGLWQAVDLMGGDVRRELRGGDDGQPGRHRLRNVRAGGPQDLGVPLRNPRHASRPATGGDPRDDTA